MKKRKITIEEGALFDMYAHNPEIDDTSDTIYLESSSFFDEDMGTWDNLQINPPAKTKQAAKKKRKDLSLSKVGKFSFPTLNMPILETCLKSSAFAEHPAMTCTHCYAKAGGSSYPTSLLVQEKNLEFFRREPAEFFGELGAFLEEYQKIDSQDRVRTLENILAEADKSGPKLTSEAKKSLLRIASKPTNFFRYFSCGDIPEDSAGNPHTFLMMANVLASKLPSWMFWMPSLKFNVLEEFAKNNVLEENFIIRSSSPILTWPENDNLRRITPQMHKAGIRMSHVFWGNPAVKETFRCVWDCDICGRLKVNDMVPACFHKDIEVIGYENHKGDSHSPKTVIDVLEKGLKYMPGRTKSRYISKDSKYWSKYKDPEPKKPKAKK